MNPPKPATRFQFLKLVLLFALLHYLALLGLGGLIFLAGHVPPKAVNLDALISGLVAVETTLVAPRKCLLWLWPLETTPPRFGLTLTVVNSLVWSLTLTGIRALWFRASR